MISCNRHSHLPAILTIIMGQHQMDLPSHPIDHLSELITYCKKWILLWLSASIICSFFIDAVINNWIASFDYSLSDLSIYSPDRWLRMRWGSVLLAGFIISFPYASMMIDRFVKPALMPFELMMIRILNIITTFMICVIVPVFWYYIAPNSINQISSFNELENIEQNFDISMMYSIVLGLSWAIAIAIIGIMSQLVCRMIIHNQHPESIPMQWKIHMISLFMLYIVLDSSLSSIWFPLSLIVILTSEIFIGFVPSKPIGLIQNGHQTMLSDGSVHRIAVLDCRCESACPKLVSAPSNASVIRSESICLNPSSHNRLIEILKKSMITRLIVTGCDITPIPNKLISKIQSESIELIGLSWLDQRGYHPDDVNAATVMRSNQLQIACLNNSENSEELNVVDDPGWGRYISRGCIVLPQVDVFPNINQMD